MTKVMSMEFEAVETRPLPKKQGIRVLYQAPGKGPKFWVDHFNVGGCLPICKKREDLRIAFSRIQGGEVVWRDDGYYLKDTGQRVIWNRNISRFIHAETEPKEAIREPVFEEPPIEEQTFGELEK